MDYIEVSLRYELAAFAEWRRVFPDHNGQSDDWDFFSAYDMGGEL